MPRGRTVPADPSNDDGGQLSQAGSAHPRWHQARRHEGDGRQTSGCGPLALERSPQQDANSRGKAYELLVSAFDDAVVAELIDSTPCTLRGAGSPDRVREPESLSMDEVTASSRSSESRGRERRSPSRSHAGCGSGRSSGAEGQGSRPRRTNRDGRRNRREGRWLRKTNARGPDAKDAGISPDFGAAPRHRGGPKGVAQEPRHFEARTAVL